MSAISLVKRGNWIGILIAALMAFAGPQRGGAVGTFATEELKVIGTTENITSLPTVKLSEPDFAATFVAFVLQGPARSDYSIGHKQTNAPGGFDSVRTISVNAGPFPNDNLEFLVNSLGHAATRAGSSGNYRAVELGPSASDLTALEIIPRSASFAAMGDRITIAADGTIGFAAGAGPFGGFTTIQVSTTGATSSPVIDVSGIFNTLYPPTMNKSHDFVFPAFQDDNTAGFYGSTGGTIWTVADSNHGFPAFGNGTINDSGTIAFRAIETATTKEQIKIVLSGGIELKTAASFGDYDALGDPSLNNRNEVAVETFKGSIRTLYYQILNRPVPAPPPNAPTGAERTQTLAELPSPTPVVVIKTGDALSGSTVTDLKMSSQALTDNGDLVFHAYLADGREGIYMAHPKRSALLNIATRLRVLTGENVLIAGFIVTGTNSKKVIVRGIGPSLAGAGVPGTLTDPVLELHQGNATLVTNDNWKIKASDGSSQQAEIEATTIPPANDAEAALVATLAPGNYTAILSGKSAGTGNGLIEVYDLDQASTAQAVNISTRGFVDTGDNVMIGGIIAGPSDAISSRVLIRAIGPSLANAGVGNALSNPFLELHDSSGGTLYTNDDWKTRPDGSSQQSEIEATTIPPTNNLESAILGSLPPGNYTAIVRGTGNSAGVGLVEVYNLK